MKNWNTYDEVTKGAILFDEIETRQCSEDDFNDLEGSNTKSRFYRSGEYTINTIKLINQQMICIKDDNVYNMYGHYDAGQARNLMIVFEKCDTEKGDTKCKSPDEIEKWLNLKYIMTV